MDAGLSNLQELQKKLKQAKVLFEKHHYAKSNAILEVLTGQIHGSASRKLKADVLVAMGTNNFYLGNYQRAIEECREAESIYKELKLVRDLAVAAGNLGAAYLKLGLYGHSILKHLEALTYLFETNDELALVSCLCNAAAVLYDSGNTEKAYRALTAALAICDKHQGDTRFEELRVWLLNNNAYFLIRSGRFNEALLLLNSAKIIAKKFSINNQFIPIEANLSLCLISLNRFEEAWQLLNSALSRRKNVHDDHYVAVLIKMGTIQKDFYKNEAKFFELLQKALTVAERRKLTLRMVFIYRLFKDHYESKGDRANMGKAAARLGMLEQQDRANKQSGGMENLFDAQLLSLETKLNEKKQEPGFFRQFDYLTGIYSYSKRGITRRIPLKDIAFCEVKRNYMSIYSYAPDSSGDKALHEAYRLRKTMKEFMLELDESGKYFARIHNSFIINLSYLNDEALNSGDLINIAGKELKVSYTYKKEFKESANAFYKQGSGPNS